MPEIQGVDLNDLDASFGGFPAGDATPNKSQSDLDRLKGVDLGDLDAAFGNKTTIRDNGRLYVSPNDRRGKPEEAKPDTGTYANPDIARGIWQGIKDIPNTGASLIGYIDSKLSNAGAQRNEEFNKRLEAERATLPVDNTAFNVGRMGGQVLATAPLAAAIPEYAAVKAIPYVGRLGASVLRGASGGALFGAATNSANDEGLLSNVATNAGYGAAAGPIADLGAKVASKAVKGAQNIIEAIKVNNIVKDYGIDPNAARNMLKRLTDAGYTPAQADAELRGLGQSATIADLSPSLTTEASGLASKGGTATDTLKGRFGERAATANSAAHDLMENRLGSKPDYETEKAAALLDRQQQTAADYNRAKASNIALDVMPIAKYIHTEMQTAVGSEARELQAIGSYLFDRNGNIKVDTAPLHKVRKALDDILDRLPKEGTSQASGTYRAVETVRNKLDKVLKTNPDMAAADAKYARLAEDAKGLDLGREAITSKGSYEKFAREFNNASPEKQDFMRKGLRIQIGDLMEKATRGELSEAQRLFGKSSNNRRIIRLAFGRDGGEVLDALEKEANQRGVENAVRMNSLTAERRAVQERPEYGGSASEAGVLGPVAQGLMADVVTGTHGAATIIGAGKSIISGSRSSINKERIEKTIEGTADLISRQSQHGRRDALDALSRIDAVTRRRNAPLPVNYNSIGSLATRASVPATIPAVKQLKSYVDRFRGE